MRVDMSGLKKPASLMLLLVTAAAIGIYLFTRSALPGLGAAAQTRAPKYIFIFLSDGAGTSGTEAARMFNRVVHNEGLNITDKIIKEGSVGLLTVHPADSLTTDSAAAATAMASGCKAKVGALGICADGRVPKTVMETAKDRGMRIGLVTTAPIYDASPAAFTGHVSDRKYFSLIVDQYLRARPDLLMGGGRDQFIPQSKTGSSRKDDQDMIGEFTKQGYSYVSEKKDLARANGGRLLGLFTLQEMSFELDRDQDKEPSLAEMTDTAIRFLAENNHRGFMVFIESENTDAAGHMTDIASVIQGYREFDRAVGLAYNFYRKHPRETLILVTSDHDSGGLGFTLALEEPSGRHAKRMAATEADLKKIAGIAISLKKAAQILGPNPTADGIDRLMKDHFKGFKLAPDLKTMLLDKKLPGRNIYTDPVANALGMMIANNTQMYWGASGHTSAPVLVAALGVGSELFRGYQDNTDFAKNLFSLLRD